MSDMTPQLEAAELEALIAWLERTARIAPEPRIDDFGAIRLNQGARDRMRLAAAALSTLRAQVASLMAALEPFALALETIEVFGGVEFAIEGVEANGHDTISIADFRRARTALGDRP